MFSVHSNDQTPKGNGLLCSVQVDKDRHPFLLTCIHNLLKKEEKRTEMTEEECLAAICRNLRCEEAQYEFSGRDFMEAKEVSVKLMDAKEVTVKLVRAKEVIVKLVGAEEVTIELMEAKEVTVKLTAKDVLEDCKDPVIYFDKVSGWRVQLY